MADEDGKQLNRIQQHNISTTSTLPPMLLSEHFTVQLVYAMDALLETEPPFQRTV